ncbi:MAG: RluA family pseudouridine synthase [Planctomycetes bacterium]|nr:RluA family pseudouridine synthase [Planctomycetota bacterium]
MVSSDEKDPGLPLHPKAREIFRGAGLWVLDKPAGVLSHPHPGRREYRGAILQLPYDFKKEAFLGPGRPGERREIFLIHRLDQETSGLLLLAFEAGLAGPLQEMFRRRGVAKEYQALVRGIPKGWEGVWRDALRKKRASGQVQVETIQRGEPNAVTRFRVLRQLPRAGAALLALFPETGRTHQLRVQSAARGHPIAGDERYGDFAWNRELRKQIGLKRMFLHAGRMEFRHPRTGERMSFTAELPEALQVGLQKLRNQSFPWNDV